MRFLPVLSAAALVLVACAPTAAPDTSGATGPDAGHGMTTVQVSATYRERILLPPGHILTVRVEDVSLADAPARVLAEHSESLDGRAPPYQATLGFPSSEIDPRHSYAARAEIRDETGRLRFTTDTRHAVVTRGAPSSVEIVMVGVGVGAQ